MDHASPQAEQVERFRADMERLAPGPARLGVAVSGGPDSVALLLLAAAAFPGRVSAATVDHGLRSGAADEARLVAGLCGALGCPHATLAVTVKPGGDGLQGEARRARYGALGAWCADAGIGRLATGHHRDDQAETILMRLRRGAGVGGLGAIRPVKRESAALLTVRPLLGWSRAELAGIVAAAGIAPVDDPSNRDPRFDRAAMRTFLAGNSQFDPARLARSAAACAEADAALDWVAAPLFAERCTQKDGAWTIDPAGLPRALRRRLLARVIDEVGGAKAGDVEGLLAALEAGGTGTLANVVAHGGLLWRIGPAPPRRGHGIR